MSSNGRCKQCNSPALRTPGMKNFCCIGCRDLYKVNQKKRDLDKRVGKKPIEGDILFDGYKEPLIKIEKGYGYYGTIALSKDKALIQCHRCGKMYRALGPHVLNTHKLTLDEYREQYKLAGSNGLIGEKTREALIETYDKHKRQVLERWKSMSVAEKLEWKAKHIASNKSRKGTKMRLEIRNKRDNCPDQLLDKIKRLYSKLGRMPSVKDFKKEYNEKHTGTIYYIYGSWTNACEMAGLTSIKSELQGRYSKVKLLDYLRTFYKEHGRSPRSSDFSKGLLPSNKVYIRKFGNLNQARYEARIPIVIPDGHFAYVDSTDYSSWVDKFNLA